MQLKFILLSLVVFTLTIRAHAQDEPKYRPVRLLISGALEFGGDEVANVLFTNGETQPVKLDKVLRFRLGHKFNFRMLKNFFYVHPLGINI